MTLSRLISRLRKPFFIRRVVGRSMLPTLRPSKIVFGSSLFKVRDGDIVVARIDQEDVIKRCLLVRGKIDLRGDNLTESNNFTDIKPSMVLGRVFNA